MVNNDRIVPIQKLDWLSVVGTVMKLNNTSFSVAAASDVDGNFAVTASGAAGNILANQPLKSLDFSSGVTSATVYFVAAFDFVGFSKNGTACTLSGTVKKDGVTLYKGVLSSSTVTVTEMTPSLA